VFERAVGQQIAGGSVVRSSLGLNKR
jgi:hypothetical protein